MRLVLFITGWDDIGYSFMIGGDGSVFEGRGWDRVGAHTYGFNKRSLGERREEKNVDKAH